MCSRGRNTKIRQGPTSDIRVTFLEPTRTGFSLPIFESLRNLKSLRMTLPPLPYSETTVYYVGKDSSRCPLNEQSLTSRLGWLTQPSIFEGPFKVCTVLQPKPH